MAEPIHAPIPGSAQDVQALFNRIAPVYDALNDQFSGGLHRVWKLMTVKWIDPQPGQVVLDLCCGTGDLAFLLAERVGQTGQVYGVDFAQDILEEAAKRSSQIISQGYPKPKITPPIWQQGDALALPFGDHFFDGATVGYGLRNWSDFGQGLRELRRVLKPGAKAALLDFHRPEHPLMAEFQRWFLQQQVIPAAERLGIRDDYAYILPSLDRFPQGSGQVALAQAAGFHSVRHYPILGGMMGVLVAQA